jgi:phosphoenolpyruvate phosphomutase
LNSPSFPPLSYLIDKDVGPFLIETRVVQGKIFKEGFEGHMKKTTQLKNLIYSDELDFLMEAHNGLSAKIVEEAGFKGIWGSGLSISAAMGVRDNNEASWTQILEVLEFMNDASSIPILLDGDTGYGNFNNARRLVKKLEQRGIAGVCIEDKLFPKTNSFISGEAQPLADIQEFCGKIKAMKDSQLDNDFMLVARVEAFIAGWGLGEALKRAEAYRLAGADAILMHSKKSDISEIEAFMKEWNNRSPVIIVPTKYYSTPTDKFRDLGVSVAIWANHTLRSSITAMQKTTKQIFHDESLKQIEGEVVTVEEIFRLQGAKELSLAEKKYLPTYGKNMNSIILAASQGELNVLTKDIPKTLLKVKGKSILSMQVEELTKMAIKDITVVRGFAKEKIVPQYFKVIDNDDYKNNKELYSLFLAKEEIKGDTIISYGDIIYKNYILHELLNDPNDITIIVDADYEYSVEKKDFVTNNIPYSKKVYDQQVHLIKMSEQIEASEVHGEFIGLWKVTEKGAKHVKEALLELGLRTDFKCLTMADLFNYVLEMHPISVRYIKGSWLDIDTIVDLQKAGDL